MNLPLLRKRIDRLDRRLLHLLNARAQLALQVGRLKRQRRLAVLDRRRERLVLRHVSRANRGPLSRASLERIFREILRQSRRLETKRDSR